MKEQIWRPTIGDTVYGMEKALPFVVVGAYPDDNRPPIAYDVVKRDYPSLTIRVPAHQPRPNPWKAP